MKQENPPAAAQSLPRRVIVTELIRQRRRGTVIVRSLGGAQKSHVAIHAAVPLHAQDWLVSADALDLVLDPRRTILEPAMRLERVGNDPENHARKKAVSRQEFEERQRIE